jgi:hypothetical protein
MLRVTNIMSRIQLSVPKRTSSSLGFASASVRESAEISQVRLRCDLHDGNSARPPTEIVLPSRRPDSVAAIYLLFREEGIVSFGDGESSSLNRNRTVDIGIRGMSFLAREVA